MSGVSGESAGLCDRLVDIWREELLLGAASADVDFVEVDGSSLTAVRIMNRVSALIERHVEIAVLFDYATPRSLAAALTDGKC